MFICPTCGKEFKTEQNIQKHFLSCWKERHPYHKSKSALHSENITREISNDIIDFFNSFKENNNGRSNDS